MQHPSPCAVVSLCCAGSRLRHLSEGGEENIVALRQVVNKMGKRLVEIPQLITRLDTLTTEVKRYKGLIEKLNLNLEEMKAQERRPPQVAVMVDEAKPPPGPSFPIVWLNLLVAALAGLLVGVLYAFFINYLEETREERIFKLVRAIEKTEG